MTPVKIAADTWAIAAIVATVSVVDHVLAMSLMIPLGLLALVDVLVARLAEARPAVDALRVPVVSALPPMGRAVAVVWYLSAYQRRYAGTEQRR